MASLQEGAVKMYSLDQVIYFLEQRQQTEDWNIRDAAIAYLKGYREVLPEYGQMKLDAIKNEPLTWDELKAMEGKPVWVESDGKGHWDIVNTIYDKFGQLVLSLGGMSYHKDWQGIGWQAYRKERTE